VTTVTAVRFVANRCDDIAARLCRYFGGYITHGPVARTAVACCLKR